MNEFVHDNLFNLKNFYFSHYFLFYLLTNNNLRKTCGHYFGIGSINKNLTSLPFKLIVSALFCVDLFYEKLRPECAIYFLSVLTSDVAPELVEKKEILDRFMNFTHHPFRKLLLQPLQVSVIYGIDRIESHKSKLQNTLNGKWPSF